MNKKVISMFICTCLLLAGCTIKQEEITLEDNQSWAYGMVTTISGNKLAYTKVEESVIEAMTSTETSEQNTESMNSTEEGMMGGGTPPDMNANAEDTSKAATSTATEDTSTEESSKQAKGGMGMGGMVSGESVSTMIPVGTVVHIDEETETTFSRIASGDVLKLLMETDDEGNDVIVEIWMVS